MMTCWLRRSRFQPPSIGSNFLLHTHRENNAVADAAANKLAWEAEELIPFDVVLESSNFIRVHFDGSFKDDGRAAAGVVLFLQQSTQDAPKLALRFCIPLAVDSACQAELCACVAAVVMVHSLAKRRSFTEIRSNLRKLEGASVAFIGNLIGKL